MLPLSIGGYLDTTNFPREGRNFWYTDLGILDLDLFICIERDGIPGWVTSFFNIGTFLIVPSSSEMARRWGPDNGVSVSGGSNHSSLGLVESS